MQDDGKTRRDHLEARATKKDAGARLAASKLVGPEMPEALEYLWVWWGELNLARRVGPHGLDPIDYKDVDAWARLLDREPTSYEVHALLRLDSVMRSPRAD